MSSNKIMVIFMLFLFCFGFSDGVNVGHLEGRKGQWQLLLKSTGVVAMHTALTFKNTVIMFDQTGARQSSYQLRRRFNGSRCTTSRNDLMDSTCYAHSVEYDIVSNKVRPLRLDTDPWCSSGSFLSNGTLLQTGGFGQGAKRVRLYRPSCGNHQCDWIQTSKFLSDERWYASTQILPDHDRVVVVGGRRVFTYEFVPKISHNEKSFHLPFMHQTRDDQGNNNLYPFLHLSSDGNLFIFANRDSILLNLRRNEVIKTFPRIPGKGSRNYPSSGSSALLPLDHRDNFQKVEVMVCGGSATGAIEAARERRRFLQGLRSCGRMVITGNNHKWEMDFMPKPRLMHDMLILPTGDILIINGAKHGCAGYDNARNASLEPYLYSPKRRLGKRFTVLRSTKIARMYHSSATLLADGRVLVAGGNPHGRYIFHNVAYPTELRLQAFVPHYMNKRYDDWRPSNLIIEEAPIRYGTEFRVLFFLGRRPSKVVEFIAYAPPFTTHSFSMNQRMLKLRCKSMVRGGADGWMVAVLEAPPSPNVAPSGYYLLTVVNGGIPSMSQWIQFAHA